ncbi:MAG: 50S ribosomal protein L29 [Candidatus Zixiibacteriota bacterium]
MTLKNQSLREMTREELVQKKTELDEEMFNLKMRQSLKALDNPLRLRHLGREIAQVLTILNEDRRGIRKLAERATTVLADAKTD